MISFPLMCVQTFDCMSKSYVFDGNTLIVARVSKELRTALELAKTTTEPEWIDRLRRVYGDGHSESLIAAIGGMARKGMFQSPDETWLETNARRMRDKGLANARLTSISLLVSGTCNLRCGYCYADAGSFNGDSKAPFMDLDTVEAAMDLVCKASRPVVYFNILGGEPTLHPKFWELLKIVRSRTQGSGIKAIVSVSTNGTVFRPKLAEALVEQDVHIGVSIDGPGWIHDKQRPFASGEGSFSSIMSNIRSFVSICGLDRVSLRVTCTPQNISTLLSFLAQIRDTIGMVKVSFQPVIVGDSHTYKWSCDFIDRFKQFQEEVFAIELKAKANQLMAKPDRAAMVARSQELYFRTRRFAQCELGINMLFVTCDGDIYPCVTLIGRTDFLMGNVNDGTIRRSEGLTGLMNRNTVFGRDQCRDCWAKFLCGGGCLSVNLTMGNDFTSPTKALCELYKSIATMRIWEFIALSGFAECAVDTKAAVC